MTLRRARGNRWGTLGDARVRVTEEADTHKSALIRTDHGRLWGLLPSEG
jgi:hypothetical protein